MILYGVTVYNAILIISYCIITYKLIYITVPEEHLGASSMWLAPGPRLPSWFQGEEAKGSGGCKDPALGPGSGGAGVRGCGQSRCLAHCAL